MDFGIRSIGVGDVYRNLKNYFRPTLHFLEKMK